MSPFHALLGSLAAPGGPWQACEDHLDWAAELPAGTSLEAAWAQAPAAGVSAEQLFWALSCLVGRALVHVCASGRAPLSEIESAALGDWRRIDWAHVTAVASRPLADEPSVVRAVVDLHRALRDLPPAERYRGGILAAHPDAAQHAMDAVAEAEEALGSGVAADVLRQALPWSVVAETAAVASVRRAA